jgi:hypothetical protein
MMGTWHKWIYKPPLPRSLFFAQLLSPFSNTRIIPFSTPKSVTFYLFRFHNFDMKTACASILLLASMAMATDHVVLVGSTGLTFSPDQITATVGDTVSFQFVKGVWPRKWRKC